MTGVTLSDDFGYQARNQRRIVAQFLIFVRVLAQRVEAAGHRVARRGQFNNKNAGKRGISLNIGHPKGLQIAKDLVRICDVVAEGFSPGVLQRLGLGYDVLKSIRPDVIYIQQSGMGAHGTYGRMRTVGPVAAAFGGQGEMSGLPEPAMPVGWMHWHCSARSITASAPARASGSTPHNANPAFS
jgi:crotonobetainyl-CoA:carnitine CoA-transferase CaiB-like acyl-CoA transferase